MITKKEEVMHYYGKEVVREEEHPWLEEWHTVLVVGVCRHCLDISVTFILLEKIYNKNKI